MQEVDLLLRRKRSPATIDGKRQNFNVCSLATQTMRSFPNLSFKVISEEYLRRNFKTFRVGERTKFSLPLKILPSHVNNPEFRGRKRDERDFPAVFPSHISSATFPTRYTGSFSLRRPLRWPQSIDGERRQTMVAYGFVTHCCHVSGRKREEREVRNSFRTLDRGSRWLGRFQVTLSPKSTSFVQTSGTISS